MKICGIDEAGRGPLAGPLVIAGVVFKKKVYKIDDSKKLSPKKRESLYAKIIEASEYKIVIIENSFIDENGLSAAISKGLKEIKDSIKASKYIFDGNSSFGAKDIEAIIKADQKIPEVMAASILAKVVRDRLMCDYAKKYPEYNFCKNKGYGTKEHIEAIKKYGYSSLHRKSFKLKALQKTLF